MCDAPIACIAGCVSSLDYGYRSATPLATTSYYSFGSDAFYVGLPFIARVGDTVRNIGAQAMLHFIFDILNHTRCSQSLHIHERPSWRSCTTGTAVCVPRVSYSIVVQEGLGSPLFCNLNSQQNCCVWLATFDYLLVAHIVFCIIGDY